MKRVLLADDERSSSDIIRHFIETNGLPLEIVGITADGEETVREIKRLKPELVFLDIEMPLLNGLQVMERIRAEYKRDVTFIIISAYSSFEYIQTALRMNAKDYLLKPILYPQFCEMMQRVLGYQYSENPLFNQLMEYLDEHYSEELQLSDCAEALAVSKSNVARLLRVYANSNFTAYLNELRIRKAKELLQRGVQVKDAAFQVGYNNLNYFYRMFRKMTGITPKEYVSAQPQSE